MSAVKANKVQIGQSATPANNITIETPAVPDGSFKIRKGVHDGSGVVLFQVDASGNPTYPTQTPRTWQSFTGSRVVGTTYTNNTGREIEVSVSLILAGAQARMMVNGVQVGVAGSTTNDQLAATVPVGANYSITNSAGTATIDAWSELRP